MNPFSDRSEGFLNARCMGEPTEGAYRDNIFCEAYNLVARIFRFL